ncbi:hypothetical protein BTA51_19555 [Hahella sp. CCB-MM4]|uniref:efflux RND transporter periplasmic adaptor subunit n=1 Tax=Hahella sp. (strain CCB-MM4) TaxID=1926491 RepID=UPI000B9BF9C2|nr:efflux RND transporter periplasmic adaptor subunit [Hahella sp. CCB-MM4]OZG71821.1 hypothetical protein BTA51_19555 [Hahella sp. CCB-MM4]
MDIKRIDKPRNHRHWWLACLVLVVISCLAVLMRNLSFGGYEVPASRVLIGEVKQGNMVVEIRGNGMLVPKHFSWIASSVEGRVETVQIKAGDKVNAGDLIAELKNPELVQKTEELRWDIEAAEAEMTALEARQQSQILDQQAMILEATHDYERARLQFDAEAVLLKRNSGSVSVLDYQSSALDTEQLREQKKIEQERLAKLILTQKAEFKAAQARINRLKKTLARSEALVAAMAIKADRAGVIQSVNLEAGQRILRGHNIAKIAALDELIAELKVPERQIKNISLGQPVVIDTHATRIRGNIIRIDPMVVSGTVQVDIEFADPLPEEARPEFSIEGTIEVSQLENVMYVPRPVFAQSNAPGSVYRLAPDGHTAERVSVVFGLGSADKIQIISGLNVADRIILSSDSAWEHMDSIRLNRS